MGADGRRPLLAWAGVAARPPPSAAAAAPQTLASGDIQPRTQAGPRAAPSGAQRAAGGPIVDADGFTLVQRHAGGAAAAVPATGAAQRTEREEALGERGGGEGSADATMSAADDDDGEAAHEGGQDQEDGGALDGGGAPPPNAEELKAAWQKEQGLLDLLVQRGYPADHPVRAAAQIQVDEAHRAWMGATPGVAVSQRLLWADKALQRVKRGQARLEQEIDELDQKYEHERCQLCQQLHEQRARVKQREAKLAELSREAAGVFKAGGECDDDGVDVIRGAVETIEEQLAPAMRAAHDLAPEGSPLRAKLEEAMGAIAAVHGMATHASRTGWADVYDMSCDDEGDSWGEGSHGDDGWHQRQGWWPSSRSHSTWYDGGYHGHWERQPWFGDTRGYQDEDEGAMDTGDVQVPMWFRAEGCDGAHWGGRSWKRGRREAEDAAGLQGRLVGGGTSSEVREHERTAMLQAQLHDAQVQQQQERQPQDQHQQQPAAGTVVPAPPTPRAEDHAALEARRRAVWDQAQNDGVPVAADDLAKMDHATLEEWAAAHLL